MLVYNMWSNLDHLQNAPTYSPFRQKWSNFREWAKNQHPILSMCMAHELHPFSRMERFSVTIFYLCWAFFITTLFQAVLNCCFVFHVPQFLPMTYYYHYVRVTDPKLCNASRSAWGPKGRFYTFHHNEPSAILLSGQATVEFCSYFPAYNFLIYRRFKLEACKQMYNLPVRGVVVCHGNNVKRVGGQE